jgi:hypothetical protein
VIAQDLPQLRPFRTGTELVLVDFVVTDKADHPVGGLSTRDFRVREDGKERPIVSLEAFAGDDLTPAGRDQALDAPVRKTARSPNATTVLLVDDGQTWMSSSASPAASPRSIRI